MGQNASQVEQGGGNGPIGDTFPEDHTQNNHSDSEGHPTGDAPHFSSQVTSSANPAMEPPRRGKKSAFPSSPPVSTQDSSRKMAGASPYQQSQPTLGDLTNEPDSSRRSKKTRRSKKHSSQVEDPSEDQVPSTSQHNAADIDAPDDTEPKQSEKAVTDADVQLDSTLTSAVEMTQSQSPKKKTRKRNRRPKLATEDAAETSLLEVEDKPSEPAQTEGAEEPTIGASNDKEENENQVGEDPDAAPKKRKRKRKSRPNVEEAELEQSLKRHKQIHNDGDDSVLPETEHQDEETQNDAEPRHDDVEYSQATQRSHSRHEKNTNSHEMEDPEPLNDADSEHEAAVDAMEGVIQVENEADDDKVEESYQDDDIDLDYTIGHEATFMAPSSSSRHHITRLSSSTLSPAKKLTSSMRNDALVTTGINHDDVGNLEDPDRSGIDETAIEDIEVPSTLPDSNGVDKHSPEPPASARTRSGRKRVAKPDFFSRMANNGDETKSVAKPDMFTRVADGDEEIANSQSPSKAALKRKKDKGKKVAVAETDPPASSSVNNRKAKRSKKTASAKDDSTEDSDVPEVSLTERTKTPKSAKTSKVAKATNTPKSVTTSKVAKVTNTPKSVKASKVPKVANTPKTPQTAKSPRAAVGLFSESDIRDLTKAMNQFGEEYEMTQHEINDMIHGDPREEKAAEFWTRTCAIFPNRPRQRLINQMRRRYHNFEVRGSWTPEQDQELRELYEKHGNKYTLIAQLLNRYHEDVRDRARNYIICGDKLRKDAWDQEETDRLIAIVEQALKEITQQRVKQDLDDSRPVEEDINWQLVSQSMNRTRSRLQCIARWKIIRPRVVERLGGSVMLTTQEEIEQAREAADAMSHRDRYLIINMMLKTEVNHPNRVPWQRIRSELGDQWTKPTLMLVYYRLRRSVPNFAALKLHEICAKIVQEYKQTRELDYPDDIDENAESSDIEKMLRRGRETKSAATVTTDDEDSENDDEDEKEDEATDEDEDDQENEQEDEEEPEEEADVEQSEEPEDDDDDDESSAEQHDTSQEIRGSVDLGAGHKDEIEDSEPEVHMRTRGQRRQPKKQALPTRDYDEESSDTNASQVASIPAA